MKKAFLKKYLGPSGQLAHILNNVDIQKFKMIDLYYIENVNNTQIIDLTSTINYNNKLSG